MKNTEEAPISQRPTKIFRKDSEDLESALIKRVIENSKKKDNSGFYIQINNK